MEAAPHRAPTSPCRGKPGKATRCLPDPVSSNKEGNEDLPRCLYRMATIKPDLHASESLEGQSLRMQGCGEEWQPCNEDIATRQRSTRGDLTCPRPSQPRVVRRRGFPLPRGIVRGPLPLPRTCLVPDRPQKRVTLHQAPKSSLRWQPAAPVLLTQDSRC